MSDIPSPETPNHPVRVFSIVHPCTHVKIYGFLASEENMQEMRRAIQRLFSQPCSRCRDMPDCHRDHQAEI
jgi:hypothetical protein